MINNKKKIVIGPIETIYGKHKTKNNKINY